MTFPADTFEEAVNLSITASNQLHTILNGDSTTEVTVEDGSKIPSIRKAYTDSLFFLSPQSWSIGGYETVYNQLRAFVEPTGITTWWFSKTATVSTPILMSTSPHEDPNWTLWRAVDESEVAADNSVYETQKRLAAEAGLNMVGSFLLGATVTTTEDVVFYETDGKYYAWGGTLPKVVATGSTPSTSGGVGVGAWVDKTNLTLREILSSPTGSDHIYNGIDTLSRVIADKSITPDSKGAVGNGYTNDQTALELAISDAGDSVELRHSKKYLVTALNNIYGKPLLGDGKVVKTVTGGLEAQTTYADQHQRVTGQENLAAWLRNLYNQHVSPTRKLKIVFSGDSTTAGVGVDAAYQIQTLVLSGITDRGLQTPYNINVVNSGHSGAPTQDWDSTYVTQDIAMSPDLYIIRWGINDPGWLKSGGAAPIDAGQSYTGRRDIADFTASLRSGLAKVRASLPFSTTSILLMMPNSTYDIPNARDALWYEQLRNVYVQAARDFNCAFIDTYSIMQDSKHLANILMDDPMSTSGRGIHPNNTMNCIIAGYIVDLIAPEGLRCNLSTNKIFSIGGAGLVVSASLLPDAYAASIYMVRCLTANGWPLDGAAITFRTADNISIQYHFGYLDADRGKLKIRYGRASVIGGQAIGWSSWYDLGAGSASYLKTAITPSSGYTLPGTGAMRVSAEGGFRCFDGYIQQTTPAIITQNTTIGTFSSAFAPTLEAAYGTATVWNGSAFEQVPVSITPAGGIVIYKTTNLLVQRVYINVSYNANT